MSVILDVKGLTKEFILHEQAKTLPGVAPTSFTVYSGRLTALVGPSGIGKSSLLKCVYRTYLPQAGIIGYYKANGEWLDLAIASESEILHLRRTEISFVTQFLYCLPRQSTLDVVAKPLFDLGMDREAAREQAAALLRQMHLPERLWKVSPATFSGGEKQRVNLARGMILQPRLLLLDEPTASLDPDSVEHVVEQIQKLQQSGTAILAVFHDPRLISRLADEVVTLKPA